MNYGLFISFEGADGSGKSTQINLLKSKLEDKGFQVIIIREPGSTKIGEEIREILLKARNINMGSITETLLYAAARAQLIEEVIKPSLEKKMIIICDRFIESSLVYQGIVRGVGIDEVKKINEYSIQDIKPDLTIYIDITSKEGLKRKSRQKKLDRIELEGSKFHDMVIDGYKKIIKSNERIYSINGMDEVQNIHEKIMKKVMSHII